MTKQVVMWSNEKFISMIVEILLNNFDCFIIIEGSRGIGKSTMAYHIAKCVYYYFNNLKRRTDMTKFKVDKDSYIFNPETDLLYKRKQVLEFFNQWRKIGIADEMINVAFNRDFYAEEQKNLIKMINMNRDHYNLFIACVPQFQTMDNQVKNLCKIRLTVVRRGMAIIQTPNRSVYSKDKWDSQINEKIEREWLTRGRKPKYTRLTTYRGFIKFPDLSEREKERYFKIKNEQRNIIYREEMAINEDGKPIIDPIENFADRLIAHRIRNMNVLEGFSIANGYDNVESFKSRIRTRLKRLNMDTDINSYFWEQRKKNPEITRQSKFEGMVRSVAEKIGEKVD
jgi:hypothetical protein